MVTSGRQTSFKILVTVIPQLLDDTRRIMEGWGPSGKFDPFDNVYEVSKNSLIGTDFLINSNSLLSPPACLPVDHPQSVSDRDF